MCLSFLFQPEQGYVGTSKNLEFAQMQGAEKISQRRICIDMLARNFFRNAAVGMKSGFSEVSIFTFSKTEFPGA